jgi:hypothetical protein
MDDTVKFFDQILSTLDNSIHPEVYHFRHGSHPGKNWFLKTVCPMPNLKQVDQLGFGALWEIFCIDHHKAAMMVPYAFDWKGNEIPYCASVWLRTGIDVLLTYSDIVGFQFDIVEEKEGREYYIDRIEEAISTARTNSRHSIEYPRETLNELDEIEDVLAVMRHNSRVLEIDELRNNLKVIPGGKDDE